MEPVTNSHTTYMSKSEVNRSKHWKVMVQKHLKFHPFNMYDLDLDLMTLIYKLGIDVVVTYTSKVRPIGQMVKKLCFTLADLGGACLAHAPHMGPNSFIFAYIFTKKCPLQRFMPPLKGACPPPPPQEILDLPLF